MIRTSLLTLSLLILFAPTVAAQGLIAIDRRPHVPIQRNHFVLEELQVHGTVREQVAEISVSHKLHNPTRQTIEAELLFPLPADGAVQNLVLLADGKELPGKLLPADEALRIYQDIVRSRKDPALLQYVGQGVYKTNVFPIPPGAHRTVTLRYTQVLTKERDLVSFRFPMGDTCGTAEPIGKLSVDIRIESKSSIKSVYSPTHDPTIKRVNDRVVQASLEEHRVVPHGEFRMMYSVANDAVGATVLSYQPRGNEDGYFMMLASPGFTKSNQKPLAKSVVFVLDKSGSMSGKKIEQAREALRFVIRNLNEGDTFNIITYDDRIEQFKPELQSYDKTSRDEALSFIGSIRAGGSTNIDGALRAALGMLADDSRPNYVLFLTDGLPTAGEKNEMRIAENAKAANKVKSRIIGFGVGHDVNSRLLDRVTHGNGGVSEYVGPDEDIEAVVGRFYGRIASPVLSDLALNIDGVKVNQVYPRDLPDLFEGGQLVVVGRYENGSEATLKLTGKIDDVEHAFIYPAAFAHKGENPQYAFVEKVWAARRIGDLIDQIDLHGKSDELVKELVELSTRHGILTPYTSFLADENVRLDDVSANAVRGGQILEALDVQGGASGFAQRRAKNSLQSLDKFSEKQVADNARLLAEADRSVTRGRGGFGGGGAAFSQPAPAAVRPGAPAAARPADPPAGQRAQSKVMNLAGKAFFNKANVWQDSEVTTEEAENAIAIKQFSDEHFALAAKLKGDAKQYLAQTLTVIVKIDGKVYRIEAAEN